MEHTRFGQSVPFYSCRALTGHLPDRLLHSLSRSCLRLHPIHYGRRCLRLADPRHPSLGCNVDGDCRLHPPAARLCDCLLQVSARADLADRHWSTCSPRSAWASPATCSRGISVRTGQPPSARRSREAFPSSATSSSKLLRGGPDLSALTLQRFFSAHIWMLPAVLAAFDRRASVSDHQHGESHLPTKED